MSTLYYSQSSNKTYSMSRVFGWMFFAILLTAITAFGLPYLLVGLNADNLYYPIMIGGLISVFILTFVGQFIIAKTRSKILAITIFSLFAISMGIWVSPLVLIYDLQVVGTSLLVTSVIFGAMAIYGAVTKRDLTGFGNVLFMLIMGSLIVSVINIFIANSAIDWVISYVLLGVYIGFVAYDVQNVKNLAESGNLTSNIALIMALHLYIDFVYIFIRLLSIIGRSRD